MNQVIKTVKCGIVNLTRIKERQLSREYDNLQNFLHGNERVELYSANKQQALPYLLLRDSLDEPPYNSGLRKVGSYLWNLDEIRAKDIGIFVCLALALVFAFQNIACFIGWLHPLCIYTGT